MLETPKFCRCGRKLEWGETKCPSHVREDEAWWKQAGGIAGSVALAAVTIGLAIVTGGKIRPKV